MTDKQVVHTIEPTARIEKTETGWLVRKHSEGPVLGSGVKPERAWRAARLTLFSQSIKSILSEIPVVEK
jgi:hypothetical protein